MRVDMAFMKKEAKALENLIKGYRDLQYKLKEKICFEGHQQFKKLQENTIPKSKVKEKIEELESYKGLVMYEKYNYEVIINHLQELMEDK
jgi:hypothetical protein